VFPTFAYPEGEGRLELHGVVFAGAHLKHWYGRGLGLLFGYDYALVAPKEHREQVTGDFTMEEYIELQRLVYRVTEAVREEVGAERMYIYTFGSNQGNSHVHWHVVSLPPGVPYEDQQGNWASWSKGVLEIPEEEMAALAGRIGQRLERIYPA
jgi:diadenosine tetraphosphate (Ap4A) HIT family hydrolase